MRVLGYGIRLGQPIPSLCRVYAGARKWNNTALLGYYGAFKKIIR